ncbi:MAG TPA: prepilin peptidase [Acidobacteriaceae bacterium]|nr:prepilin peptidase [Acidobacteriaceae bacterium]
MASPTIFALSAFLLGLLFGSFLNVCISRLPTHQSIVTPRSHCPHCHHTIRWYDNIPFLSWHLLRARCRDCKTPISARYPAVELAIALLWAISAAAILAQWRCNHVQMPDMCSAAIDTPAFESLAFYFLRLAILGFLLIGLMVMDWQTLRLPDAFTLPGIVLGFLLVCAQAAFLAPGQGDIVLNTTHQFRLSSPGSGNALGNVFLTGTEALVLGRVAAILGAALILLIARWIYKALRKQEGLGLGDVKLLAMIAAFLGFPQSLLALFVGVLSAALYALALLARRNANRNTRLPLGSFLAAGGLFSALFGPAILDWYANLLR